MPITGNVAHFVWIQGLSLADWRAVSPCAFSLLPDRKPMPEIVLLKIRQMPIRLLSLAVASHLSSRGRYRLLITLH